MFHSISTLNTALPSAAPSSPQGRMAENVTIVESRTQMDYSDGNTRVSLSGQSRSLTYSRSQGVDAYQAVGEVAAPAAEANNPYADTILGFIGAQLQRDVADGATQEELQSRLESGLAGFKQGYGEALEQLQGITTLAPAVQRGIEQTYQQVTDGIRTLAEKLGLSVPESLQDMPSTDDSMEGAVQPSAVAVAPAKAEVIPGEQIRAQLGGQMMASAVRDMRTLEQFSRVEAKEDTYRALGNRVASASRYGYQVSENRDFQFTLRTQDGDNVTIRVQAGKTGTATLDLAGRAGPQLTQSGGQYDNFEFSVEGELDAEELHALNELLGQVGDISDMFFNGDLEGAFSAATQLSFNKEEIGYFSVNLSRTVREQSVTEGPRHAKPWQAAEHFTPPKALVSKVNMAADLAEQLHKPRTLVADLTDWVAQQTHPQHPRAHQVGGFVRSMI